MTSLGLFYGLFGLALGRTPTNMAFLRVALLHINDISHGADYKAGVLFHVLWISARLKQNAETCIKTTSGFKH